MATISIITGFVFAIVCGLFPGNNGQVSYDEGLYYDANYLDLPAESFEQSAQYDFWISFFGTVYLIVFTTVAVTSIIALGAQKPIK